MSINTSELTQQVQESRQWVEPLVNEVSRVVVGQKVLVHRLLIGLLSNGHVLLEGVPGLAKTLTVRTLANSIRTGFQRLQFTPDLLPADLIGTLIYNPRDGEFSTKLGPIFSNLILADEINRAPAKVQSALLEAMQERQVTVDGETHVLEAPFMVVATQNPIEFEGTFPLPEAQLDRFAMVVRMGYPTREDEERLLAEQGAGDPVAAIEPVATVADVRTAIAAARALHVEPAVNGYAVSILERTRDDARLSLGASPRAGVALMRVARARALLEGRLFVTPDDVRAVAVPVLAHRLQLAGAARAAGAEAAGIVDELVARTPVPM